MGVIYLIANQSSVWNRSDELHPKSSSLWLPRSDTDASTPDTPRQISSASAQGAQMGRVCAAAPGPEEAADQPQAVRGGQLGPAAACSDPRRTGTSAGALWSAGCFLGPALGVILRLEDVRCASEQPGRRARAWPGDQR